MFSNVVPTLRLQIYNNILNNQTLDKKSYICIMKKYKKIFLDYFGYGEQDFIPCVMCGNRAVDVHHIKYRSQGGKDVINNLAGLCRNCHNKAHNNREFNDRIKRNHIKRLAEN